MQKLVAEGRGKRKLLEGEHFSTHIEDFENRNHAVVGVPISRLDVSIITLICKM